MARTDTLGNFLTDVADAIREKGGTSEPIQASSFDTAIANLPSGGGADLNEYFYTEITENTSSSSNMKEKITKKMPDITVADTVTSLSYAYQNASFGNVAPKLIFNSNVSDVAYIYQYAVGMKELDLSGWNTGNVTSFRSLLMLASNTTGDMLETINFGSNFDTSNVTTMRDMFGYRKKITSLDLSSFTAHASLDTRTMFNYCTALTHLDMRKFEFTNITNSSSMFGNNASSGPPDNCEIIVKDATQKQWLNTNFSRLTNVKTVAEYESE